MVSLETIRKEREANEAAAKLTAATLPIGNYYASSSNLMRHGSNEVIVECASHSEACRLMLAINSRSYAVAELIELAERLTPSGEIGDGMVARFHELAKRAKGN